MSLAHKFREVHTVNKLLNIYTILLMYILMSYYAWILLTNFLKNQVFITATIYSDYINGSSNLIILLEAELPLFLVYKKV